MLHCVASLHWQPYTSPLKIGAWAVVLAVLALFACLRIVREHPRASITLLLMRLIVIATVSVLLMGPRRELQAPLRGDRPRMLVLVDTSQSMLTDDCAGRSRISCVAEDILSESRLRDLQTDYELEVF